MKLSIVETRTVPTVKAEFKGRDVFFHSRYDPLNEAQAWLKKGVKAINKNQVVIVIGLGAGYHIQQLAESISEQTILIIEFNDTYFSWFKNSPFHSQLTRYNNVVLKRFNELTNVEKEKIFTSISSTNLLIHKSGLDIMPEEYKGIKEALEDIQFQQNSFQHQVDIMRLNFEKNRMLNDQGIGDLTNMYAGKPMILISAGPSLDKQLSLLKKIYEQHQFVIGAVGTALKPLLNANIIPDFFAIIDPNPATYSQMTDIELPITPLFYLSTAYHETILLHQGPRHIVYQEGYTAAEKLASKKHEPVIQTGGSVATALLDIMVKLGAKSVALVGQDLAYTDGKSHANTSHARQNIKELEGSKQVMNYYQTAEVHTAKNLTIYRKWFEKYREIHNELALYNCTEGGAYIKNWKHISLNEYYLKYS